jgi:hypothetical protein
MLNPTGRRALFRPSRHLDYGLESGLEPVLSSDDEDPDSTVSFDVVL